MAGAAGTGGGLGGLLVKVVLLAVLSGQLVTCSGPGVELRQSVAQAEDAGVSLAWASTDYGVREPEGAVVALDVVVRNRTGGVTQSTSIEWEPSFAAAYRVLESDPPAWRVHVAEDGWGVLDTNGVPANEDGAFRVWFGEAEGAAEEANEAPRIRVAVNGERRVGEGTATPVHAAERERAETQRVFERGGLAVAADYAVGVPASGKGVFPVVVGFAAVLAAISAAGLLAVYCATVR